MSIRIFMTIELKKFHASIASLFTLLSQNKAAFSLCLSTERQGVKEVICFEFSYNFLHQKHLDYFVILCLVITDIIQIFLSVVCSAQNLQI